ncbi:39134_t:CDS:1, partial [Gigaspora margarita]
MDEHEEMKRQIFLLENKISNMNIRNESDKKQYENRINQLKEENIHLKSSF